MNNTQWNLDLYKEPFKNNLKELLIHGTIYDDMAEPVALILNKELAKKMAQQYEMVILERDK